MPLRRAGDADARRDARRRLLQRAALHSAVAEALLDALSRAARRCRRRDAQRWLWEHYCALDLRRARRVRQATRSGHGRVTHRRDRVAAVRLRPADLARRAHAAASEHGRARRVAARAGAADHRLVRLGAQRCARDVGAARRARRREPVRSRSRLFIAPSAHNKPGLPRGDGGPSRAAAHLRRRHERRAAAALVRGGARGHGRHLAHGHLLPDGRQRVARRPTPGRRPRRGTCRCICAPAARWLDEPPAASVGARPLHLRSGGSDADRRRQHRLVCLPAGQRRRERGAAAGGRADLHDRRRSSTISTSSGRCG